MKFNYVVTLENPETGNTRNFAESVTDTENAVPRTENRGALVVSGITFAQTAKKAKDFADFWNECAERNGRLMDWDEYTQATREHADKKPEADTQNGVEKLRLLDREIENAVKYGDAYTAEKLLSVHRGAWEMFVELTGRPADSFGYSPLDDDTVNAARKMARELSY